VQELNLQHLAVLRFSKPLLYHSANRPDIGGCGRSRTCKTLRYTRFSSHVLQAGPPHQWGLRIHTCVIMPTRRACSTASPRNAGMMGNPFVRKILIQRMEYREASSQQRQRRRGGPPSTRIIHASVLRAASRSSVVGVRGACPLQAGRQRTGDQRAMDRLYDWRDRPVIYRLM
jgi:hypothetical protein